MYARTTRVILDIVHYYYFRYIYSRLRVIKYDLVFLISRILRRRNLLVLYGTIGLADIAVCATSTLYASLQSTFDVEQRKL